MYKTILILIASTLLTACAGSPAHNLMAGRGLVCTPPASCLSSTNIQRRPGFNPHTHWAIKGFALGQTMATCPVGTLHRSQHASINLTMCHLGPTSYAGAEATDLLVVIYNQQIISVMVKLTGTGQYSNNTVRRAMFEHFGEPSVSKPHVNEYMWYGNDSSIAAKVDDAAVLFDGWKGTVLLVNRTKIEQSQAERADAVKSDM